MLSKGSSGPFDIDFFVPKGNIYIIIMFNDFSDDLPQQIRKGRRLYIKLKGKDHGEFISDQTAEDA